MVDKQWLQNIKVTPEGKKVVDLARKDELDRAAETNKAIVEQNKRIAETNEANKDKEGFVPALLVPAVVNPSHEEWLLNWIKTRALDEVEAKAQSTRLHLAAQEPDHNEALDALVKRDFTKLDAAVARLKAKRDKGGEVGKREKNDD